MDSRFSSVTSKKLVFSTVHDQSVASEDLIPVNSLKSLILIPVRVKREHLDRTEACTRSHRGITERKLRIRTISISIFFHSQIQKISVENNQYKYNYPHEIITTYIEVIFQAHPSARH